MENEDKKEPWFKSEYLRVFIHISSWIVGPVLLTSIIGNYLDKKFNSSPLILGVGLAISFTISMVAIVKIAKKYDKDVLKEKE